MYVVWHDNITSNYEVYFAKRTDGGNRFGKSINLSNNAGLSVFPKIAVSTNNTLYVSWTDNITNTRQNQILHFAKSTDGGSSFIIQSFNLPREDVLGIPAIAASEKTNLYITWAANFIGNYVIHFTHIQTVGIASPLQLI